MPAALWCWSAIGGTSATADTVLVGALATALCVAMMAQLLWQGNYYDILDRVSPVRWAEAAIRMLREDYYDDWVRYNRKLARFKHGGASTSVTESLPPPASSQSPQSKPRR